MLNLGSNFIRFNLAIVFIASSNLVTIYVVPFTVSYCTSYHNAFFSQKSVTKASIAKLKTTIFMDNTRSSCMHLVSLTVYLIK